MTNSNSRRAKWAGILALAWPLIISNSFWNLQLTIDRIFLGQYSTEALAASMAVMGVFWTPMALLQQTAAYVTTFVAQYYGAKKNEMIGPSVWQSLYLSFFGGLLFLLLIFISDPLFHWIGHDESVMKLESTYFKTLCYSALPTAIVAAVSGFYTGLGNTKIIMLLNFLGFAGNAVFDYLLIFGNFGFPELGIAGAGYATAIGTWVAALCGLWLIFKERANEAYCLKTGYRLNKELLFRFLRFGVPSGLQWALEGLAFTVFLILIGRMQNGSAGLAASGIAITVMMLAVLPALGVAQAIMVLVGQHLGEKQPHLAEEKTWSGLQVAAMYIAGVALTFLTIPQFYISWFHNSENMAMWEQVQTIAKVLLMFVGLFTIFDSMNLVFSFALKGAGDTRFVTLVALTLPWPIMILPTWFFKDGSTGVYWAWVFASIYIIIQSYVFLKRFKGGAWKSMSVIQEQKA